MITTNLSRIIGVRLKDLQEGGKKTVHHPSILHHRPSLNGLHLVTPEASLELGGIEIKAGSSGFLPMGKVYPPRNICDGRHTMDVVDGFD